MPTKIAAFIAGVVAIVGAAWAFGDQTGYRPWLKREMQEFTNKDFRQIMDQTQQNTLAIEKGKFDLLYSKKQFSELTFDERIALCRSAAVLDYSVTNEEGEPICSEKGEPIVVFTSPVK